MTHAVQMRLLPTFVIAVLMLAASTTAHATDLSGCWQGSWRSCTTRHKGPLKAHFVKCDDTHYRVHFSGRFFKIMPFRYTVTLQVVEQTEDGVTLQGSSYLGRLMGTFYYNATASDCYFRSSYSSCKDYGVFELSR